jgi:hypothetical protein
VALDPPAMNGCRFPPWSVDKQQACFVVRDANGQTLAYVYFEDEAGRRSAAKLLSKDEARRIAANVAKLVGVGAPNVTWPILKSAFWGKADIGLTPRNVRFWHKADISLTWSDLT